MMGGFHLKAHILKSQYHITSCIFAQVHRTYIQISGLLVRQRGRHSVIVSMEQEKLTFRVNITGIACLLCCLRCFSEYIWSCVSWLRPVCTAHIAHQSCNLSLLGAPWENRKGVIDPDKDTDPVLFLLRSPQYKIHLPRIHYSGLLEALLL